MKTQAEELQEKREMLTQEILQWTEFVTHPTWKKLKAGIDYQVTLQREDHFRAPIKSMDGAFVAADRIGFLSGMQLVTNFPALTLNDLEQSLAQVTTALRQIEEGELPYVPKSP